MRDDFTRADENPLSNGGSWTTKVLSTDADLKVVGNQCAATSLARCGAYWNAAQFNDCEAYLTLATMPTADGCGVWLRVQNPGSGSSSGYMGWYHPPTTTLRIWRLDAGVLAALSSTVTISLAAGDMLWFRAAGGTLVLASGQAGVWTDRITQADPTYKAGYIGIFGGADTAFRLDDFGGGNPLESFIASWRRRPVPMIQGPDIDRIFGMRGRFK